MIFRLFFSVADLNLGVWIEWVEINTYQQD